MVVFFTASMGFSAIHTLHIAIGDPIIINKYIPFIVFVINAIAMFLLGSFYTKNEAAHIKNTVNRDIENKYKDIVDFIKLSQSPLVGASGPALPCPQTPHPQTYVSIPSGRGFWAGFTVNKRRM